MKPTWQTIQALPDGTCLPTYVVYKATNLYSDSEWVEGGPCGTRYNCTKSGWFDSDAFEDYFKTIIVQWGKKISGPKVVIGDNLSSHINIEVVELCQQHDIRLVFLAPNSTHLTQPLDVSFFGPLKREWRRILLEYKVKNPGQTTLNKKHFPKLLAELIEKIQLRETKNIKSGFRATGIWPLNPINVTKRIPELYDKVTHGIDSALLDYLNETRSPNPMTVKRSKKKLKTEPGKSVCVEDISIKDSNTKKTNATNKNKKHINTEEDIVIPMLNENTEEKIETDEEIETHILHEETGQIVKKEFQKITLKFLRKIKNAKGKKLAFTYPNVEDTCEMMHLNDIILVLPQPNISRRAQIIFDINLRECNVQ
ncbi:unnamed protein product [Parnassius apollo]|uniref:(apollo) hypothetical protein n=1 Tax=Parnassius apollo TaxID=110799 RepID=A0A8S3WKG0_PARAO|nr:unnamed protein product [Parnassius apollo]